MNTEIATLTVILTILWFIVYWIFGGVLFSLISFLKPGKLKRARFSCLYTLVSAVSGYLAASIGINLAQKATGEVPQATSFAEAIMVVGGLGFVGILLGLIAGFMITFTGGYIAMAISRSKEKSWYDRAEQETENELN